MTAADLMREYERCTNTHHFEEVAPGWAMAGTPRASQHTPILNSDVTLLYLAHRYQPG